jgi:signal-transduction protein with cAMP-binding, CBS, and nucleotidyltransferase domain
MHKQDYLLYLKSLSLFQDIANSQLKRIVEASSIIKKEEGDIICLQKRKTMIIILSGSLHIYFKESQDYQYKMGSLTTNDVFMPSAFLHFHKNGVSIILKVREPTIYMEVPLQLIINISSQHPLLQRNILRSFHKNLKSSYDEIVNLMS